MPNPEIQRQKIGLKALINPLPMIRFLRMLYTTRFGPEFSRRMVAGYIVMLVGTWLMVASLPIMIIVGIGAGVAFHSVGAAFAVMTQIFTLIIIGYAVMMVGLLYRGLQVRTAAKKMFAADPQLSVARGTQLLVSPALLDPWLHLHPDVFPTATGTS
jgi:hypothetical protein